ncbi:MarC family protein [Komagataeibacter sp. FNDCR2]|uniref:MarC family protein n=1 Tax=Komagataeibacter sp. FNDCR2 TaxID=2878682 RepID=UPI001E4D4FCD|nr:MarC family protein [Komagataeibacter sp. FNDCR2]MCE2576141.1 MarC family protein [Komagataeibacter sp. FNDCR2]
MDHTEIVKALGTFLAIMNPFLSLPVFLAMTSGFSVAQQRVLAVKVTLFSAIMCLVILLAGQKIISFFGITIDQFRVAGGIVLAQISWSMLNGSNIPSHQGSHQEQAQLQNLSGLAFYPLTFPMLIGPGTIATIIIYTGRPAPLIDILEIGGIIAGILLVLFVTLFFASEIGKVMSETMRTITTRLMGMILLAISVGMVIAGLKAVLPGLSR